MTASINLHGLGTFNCEPNGVALTPAAATTDLGALTSAQNATTNASAPSVGYVQAEAASAATLVNALKVNYNAAQVDIASLRTKLNAALDALRAAGLIAP